MKVSGNKGVNKPLITRWIKALESGKFSQAKGRLKRVHGNKESFCCLGVLREIEPKVFEGRQRQSGLLPQDGLDRCLGTQRFPQDVYASYNDDDGMSFKDIAGVLRQRFKIKG